MKTSDTPRTDAVACDGWSGDACCAPLEFTQKLERENIKLKKQVNKLRYQVRKLKGIVDEN